MNILIGLFILGAVLMLASLVFNLVFMAFAFVVAGVANLFGWIFKRR